MKFGIHYLQVLLFLMRLCKLTYFKAKWWFCSLKVGTVGPYEFSNEDAHKSYLTLKTNISISGQLIKNPVTSLERAVSLDYVSRVL